ncbi:DEAD/DEAH box helicase [Photobacterium sp. ZSDE20]|uniref:DEAD/DEAH box helicase n=1 Tax=Photobacterium pectinilyticum TaxID=2906793 RepID=A0ABT1N628_9GAMM|nr:DEAD/DEAH box helicase [Photobacterium sp. ZSDE20]MCQ1059562.1 DEAD/DEAH box helicase [Photobacterium sp. ZSDE20]MDD1825425.1 DEAD/DEAH box helicase [Photobacterium sp. ZSDE20]
MDELITINQEIAALKAKLARLEEKKLTLLNAKDAEQPTFNNQMSPEKKVELFQHYFRGNHNCYATRWQNKQGRSGYSIACNNEWQPDLCNKPKVKCLECPNQAFKPLDTQAIYDHLSGNSIIGIYPMDSDSHCWFLAIDFDKSDWKEAALAYAEACRVNEIDYLLERSRSGNGAHIWIFFEDKVHAASARKLGFKLLDQAMQIHGNLSFESYDRLFPNQDTLPIAGIGNLIALPLQKAARKDSNSEFIDATFTPYQDQWQVLGSTKKISTEAMVKLIASDEVAQQGESGSASQPWDRNLPSPIAVISGCPESINIVLANKVYIPMERLPNALIAKLKKLASFSNPKFFKAQGLRLSTNGISRYISLAEVDSGYLALPRGCIDDAFELLEQTGIRINLEDKRRVGTRLRNIKFNGELRNDQKKAIEAISKFDIGVLHAPTAFGKTVTAIGLVCRRKINTLILVHNKQLVEQWQERLKAFMTGSEVGTLSGTKKKPTKLVDVATYQSLLNRGDNTVNPVLHEYGQIIIDECHHLSAPQYERLLSEVHSKYILGISATLERRDGHQPIIFMQAGKVRHTIKPDSSAKFIQSLQKKEVILEAPLKLTTQDPRPHIADVYRWLIESEARNHLIINDIIAEIRSNRVPIVLTERREHAKALGQLLTNNNIQNEVLVGAMNKRDRDEVNRKLATTQVLVATGRFIGEGFDLPRLDTLVLALPMSWKGALVQYVGRIQREFDGKDEIRVIDYVDVNIPMLVKMYAKRSRGYKALGFDENTSMQSHLFTS